VILWLLAIFAFAPETHSAWQAVCEDRPYYNGEVIQSRQMEGLERLHELGVPGFLPGQPFPSALMIGMSCENFEAFLHLS